MSDLTLSDLSKTYTKSSHNLRWFLDNRDMLINDFSNKFVAIEDRMIIDSDDNLDELLKRLENNERYSGSTMIQLITRGNTKVDE
jgi:hypothetical protein